MILISATMFILGVLAFLDTIFSYGSFFRVVFSGLLIAMSIWVFTQSKKIGDLKPANPLITDHQHSKHQEQQEAQADQGERNRDRKSQPVS